VQKQHHDVVVSTYGRGLYILHDITRLEGEDRAGTSAAYLYPPRPGFRFARAGRVDFTYTTASEGGPVRFEIRDAAGTLIRTLEAPARIGENRAVWDLRHKGPVQVALRTTPPDNPFIWEEPRFKGQQTRSVLHWGIQQPQRVGPLASPGKYTVRMIVDGKSQEHAFDVLQDPSIASSVEDLRASTAMQIELRDRLTETAEMVNRLEWLGRTSRIVCRPRRTRRCRRRCARWMPACSRSSSSSFHVPICTATTNGSWKPTRST
jgi:hypothetical protein